METIKVKRSANSHGHCKLSWSKTYKASSSLKFHDCYKIGNKHYKMSWFVPIMPKPKTEKPTVTTDPQTGKLMVKQPKPDIKKTIAEYIKKYGTDLTAIELIGHLTLDEI